MTEAAFWWVHTTAVATYLGATADGVKRADPVDVGCWVEDSNELVRDTSGAEVVSTTKLYAPLDTAPTTPPVAGQFTTDSEVTLPSGRLARVITTARHDSGSLDLGLDHVEVHLT